MDELRDEDQIIEEPAEVDLNLLSDEDETFDDEDDEEKQLADGFQVEEDAEEEKL